MAKHALPRTVFKKLAEDRRRGGRGKTKHADDQTLLEVFEQLNAAHERALGKRLTVSEFLKLQMIEQMVSSELSREKAKALLDKPSRADKVRFEQQLRTLKNRLSRERKRQRGIAKQIAWSRALRSR